MMQNYQQIYPLLPFIHPSVLLWMQHSAWEDLDKHLDKHNESLWAIFDALGSVVAIYMKDNNRFHTFYRSAHNRLPDLPSLSLDKFIATGILVWPQLPWLIGCRLGLNYIGQPFVRIRKTRSSISITKKPETSSTKRLRLPVECNCSI